MVSEHLLCAKHCAIRTHTHTWDIVINKSEVVSFLENISMSLERGDKQLKKIIIQLVSAVIEEMKDVWKEGAPVLDLE